MHAEIHDVIHRANAAIEAAISLVPNMAQQLVSKLVGATDLPPEQLRAVDTAAEEVPDSFELPLYATPGAPNMRLGRDAGGVLSVRVTVPVYAEWMFDETYRFTLHSDDASVRFLDRTYPVEREHPDGPDFGELMPDFLRKLVADIHHAFPAGRPRGGGEGRRTPSG